MAHRAKSPLAPGLRAPLPRTEWIRCLACYKGMNRYRVDDLVEYALSKRGRENLSLMFLAAGCIAGIVVIERL
jgi:hypothetical protein